MKAAQGNTRKTSVSLDRELLEEIDRLNALPDAKGIFSAGMIFLSRKSEKASMKISERGQLTIPKRLRDRFGLHKNAEIEIVPAEGGLLIRKRSGEDHPVDKLFGILQHPSETDRYIEELRGK